MRTVPIRIAVCVDENGNWGCIGFRDMDPNNAWMAADNLDGMFKRWLWVTADAPLPVAQIDTIPGTVEADSGPTHSG